MRGLAKNKLLKHPHETWCVAISPDNQLLATSCFENTEEERPTDLKIWDMRTNRELLSFKPDGLHIEKLSFSPDGKHLYVFCPEVRVFEVAASLLRWKRPPSRCT